MEMTIKLGTLSTHIPVKPGKVTVEAVDNSKGHCRLIIEDAENLSRLEIGNAPISLAIALMGRAQEGRLTE